MRNKSDAKKVHHNTQCGQHKASWEIQTHPKAEAAVAHQQEVITDDVQFEIKKSKG